MKNLRFCVLFPEAKNIHLIKDVGMIAYKFYQLFSTESSIACYNNDNYQYIDNLLSGLKIDFIKKRFNNPILDSIDFLKSNSSKIDVLQIFHVTNSSLVYTLIYKHFNKRGKIFLKLDCTGELLEKISLLKGIRKKIFQGFFNRVDIIGVEQEELYNKLNVLIPTFSSKLLYIPNGIDYSLLNLENISFNLKENYILQVGRLGAPEKNTEMLIEAFQKLCNIGIEGWKLLLVGERTRAFDDYINLFFEKNPGMRKLVELTGEIKDRGQLIELYKKTKIFCLTSNYESFGIVLIEAAACGNVIVSTDVGIAKELTEIGGAIVRFSDSDALAEALAVQINSNKLEEISHKNIKFIRERYNWDNIAARLYEKITSGGE